MTVDLFSDTCVCGGSLGNPNQDCERCVMLDTIRHLQQENATLLRLLRAFADGPTLTDDEVEFLEAHGFCVADGTVDVTITGMEDFHD